MVTAAIGVVSLATKLWGGGASKEIDAAASIMSTAHDWRDMAVQDADARFKLQHASMALAYLTVVVRSEATPHWSAHRGWTWPSSRSP